MILHTAYFPPLSHFEALATGEATIEANESFQKRSTRNRAEIMTADGVKLLPVPIVGGRSVRQPIRDVEVDYTENFGRVHLRSIVTAYRSAPYFDHFFDKIEPLFSLKPKYLFDLNCQITESLLNTLKLPGELRFTEEFIGADVPRVHSAPYYQTFSHLHPFAPNLSILDYLFCCGFLTK